MYEDDITKSLDNLRIPLRKLNREKTIKLVRNQLPSILGASEELWIAVKFIFNKKFLTATEKAKVGSVGHIYDSKEKIQVGVNKFITTEESGLSYQRFKKSRAKKTWFKKGEKKLSIFKKIDIIYY